MSVLRGEGKGPAPALILVTNSVIQLVLFLEICYVILAAHQPCFERTLIKCSQHVRMFTDEYCKYLSKNVRKNNESTRLLWAEHAMYEEEKPG